MHPTFRSDFSHSILLRYQYKKTLILRSILDIDLSGNTLSVHTVHITWKADWHLTLLQGDLSILSPLLTYALRQHTYWMCQRQQQKPDNVSLATSFFGMQQPHFPAAKRNLYLNILVTVLLYESKFCSIASAEFSITYFSWLAFMKVWSVTGIVSPAFIKKKKKSIGKWVEK